MMKTTVSSSKEIECLQRAYFKNGRIFHEDLMRGTHFRASKMLRHFISAVTDQIFAWYNYNKTIAVAYNDRHGYCL